MSDIPTIQKLLEAPLYLPKEHVRQNVVPTIVLATAAISFIYLAAFPLAVNRLIKQSDGKAMRDKRVLAYQITNGITNALLGILGLYFYCSTNATTVEEKIQGRDELYILGALQIGFQIWSIFVGLLYVEESAQMLLHHVAVIFASSKSVLLTNGFRHYAPLALGMLEISSVPLAIMNSFKNNKEWRDRYPQQYLASRLIFSLTFLIIRIWLFVPQHFEYLRYAGLFTYLADGDHFLTYRIFMFVSWLGAVFLLTLQIYWAFLIVRGLSNFVLSHIQIKQEKSIEKKTN